MASPLQQAAVQRKLIYIGLILVLFTSAYVFRRYGVEAYASELKLREQDRGEVTLTDTAVGLGLTGTRGFVVTVLWSDAIELQRRHEWNKLEKRVRWVTRLQPHFISPWLFQSWNLSYNVSVEMDRERDMYFYIARGIELLYDGEQKNRNHPDMRFALAHYNMNKIAQGDKKSVLMCLMQMSCIDPQERAPARFRKQDERGRPRIDLVEFEKFCHKHPQLVRRLRDKLRCKRPEDVIKFLEENGKLPSLYQEPRPDREETPLKTEPGERFPLLPPPRDNPFDPDALTHRSNINNYVDFIDAFLVAHAWFSYAQEALPKSDLELPGKDQPIADRTQQRRPKMTTLLFRMFPARAMSYVAERLEQEGWFDDKGWTVDEKEASRSQKWFPDREGVQVGDRENWGVRFWTRAYTMWQRHGEQNLLVVDPLREADLKDKAEPFRQWAGIKADDRKQFREADIDAKLRDGLRAHNFLREQEYYISLSNFRHFYHTSLVEAKPETVAARKKFFEAEGLRLQARRGEALEKYEDKDGLPRWKLLLETNPNFQQDHLIQEETYEIQLKYLDLVKGVRSLDIKQQLALQTYMGDAAAGSPAGLQWLPLLVSAKLVSQSRLLPELVLQGPFDGKIKRPDKVAGKEIEVPFVEETVKDMVRNRNPAARGGSRR